LTMATTAMNEARKAGGNQARHLLSPALTVLDDSDRHEWTDHDRSAYIVPGDSPSPLRQESTCRLCLEPRRCGRESDVGRGACSRDSAFRLTYPSGQPSLPTGLRLGSDNAEAADHAR